jgi:hypothetical protein
LVYEMHICHRSAAPVVLKEYQAKSELLKISDLSQSISVQCLPPQLT